jgi:hypothetical protein
MLRATSNAIRTRAHNQNLPPRFSEKKIPSPQNATAAAKQKQPPQNTLRIKRTRGERRSKQSTREMEKPKSSHLVRLPVSLRHGCCSRGAPARRRTTPTSASGKRRRRWCRRRRLRGRRTTAGAVGACGSGDAEAGSPRVPNPSDGTAVSGGEGGEHRLNRGSSGGRGGRRGECVRETGTETERGQLRNGNGEGVGPGCDGTGVPKIMTGA